MERRRKREKRCEKMREDERRCEKMRGQEGNTQTGKDAQRTHHPLVDHQRHSLGESVLGCLGCVMTHTPSCKSLPPLQNTIVANEIVDAVRCSNGSQVMASAFGFGWHPLLIQMQYNCLGNFPDVGI